MIHPLIGQNERWAQYAALQPPPGAQSGQAGGSAFSNQGTVGADPTVVNPISSGSGSPLSSDTNFMLFFFNSGTSSAGGSGAPTGTGSPTQTTGAPDDTSASQGGTSLTAQLLTDLQSFVADLTKAGGAGSAATSAGSATGSSAGTAASGAGTPSATSSLAQDLEAITSAVGTVAFAFLGESSPGATGAGNAGGNADSATTEPSWRDRTFGPGDGWRQRFGPAAYAASDQSGQTSATASALQRITA